MNLETLIRPELWDAVKSSYQATNYTHAIRDAMVAITTTLRDKSGLDGDGEELVGKALGFKNDKPPVIKTNPLQTQTEKDIQRGLMQVLQGMYALVRNPRSHEKLDDSKETADSIILFINYLIGLMGKSQQSFILQDFVQTVHDPYFVKTVQYADELVDTIPTRKRLDVLIEIYRANKWKIIANSRVIFKPILSKLSENEIDEYLLVVSNDLMSTRNASEVALILSMIKHELWDKIQKNPKMRAENMLIKSLSTAYYTPNTKTTSINAPTWISGFSKYFILKNNLRDTILDNLYHEDFNYHNFIMNYLVNDPRDIFDEESWREACICAISTSIRSGNEFVRDKIKNYLSNQAGKEWVSLFVNYLEDLTDTEKPEIYLPENGPRSPKTIPFLGKFEPKPNPAGACMEEDDIPF